MVMLQGWGPTPAQEQMSHHLGLWPLVGVALAQGWQHLQDSGSSNKRAISHM